MTKICSKCKQILDLDCFWKDSRQKDGRTFQCKDCKKKLLKNIRARHKKPKPLRETIPCKHCNKNLDQSYYKSPSSWYCNDCVKEIKQLKRLALPPANCVDCGQLTERANLLKTVDRCYSCAQVVLEKGYTSRTKNHVYSNKNKSVYKRKYRSDPLNKLKENVRCNIANAFANKKFSKNSSTEKILGCSYLEFLSHIESQFKNGMTWNNRQQWHLDHCVPLSLAKTYDQVFLLNHYTNFQPLWDYENQTKSDSITEQVKNHPLYLQLVKFQQS